MESSGDRMTEEPPISNSAISASLMEQADDESGHRRRALQRAARAAWLWSEEAHALLEAGRSLTELSGVGPWIEQRIMRAFERSTEPANDPTRDGFLSIAEVNRVIALFPGWLQAPHGDLQVHATYSDGSLSLDAMAAASRALGRSYIAVTDHSASLKIARGMNEAKLMAQGERIQELNRRFQLDDSTPFVVLRSIEMDVLADGCRISR